MRLLRPLPALLAALALLTLSAPAGARTYAVSRASDFTNALSQAAGSPEPDTIQLAAGTYAGQFSYTGLSDLTIAGAGPTSTTLVSNVGGASALLVATSASVTIQRLGVSLTGGIQPAALSLDGAHVVAQDVQAEVQAVATSASGVQLSGGAALRRATLRGAFADAVKLLGGAVTADQITISGADTALSAVVGGATLTATHVSATGVDYAGVAAFSATLIVTDSLLRIANGTAAFFSDDGDNPAAHASHLVLARDTVVAGAGPLQRGVWVRAGAGDVMTAVVTDTILSGFAVPLRCDASGGGSATLTTTNVSFASGTNELTTCPAGGFRATNTIVASPQFVSAATGNFRLAPTSPLLDVSDAVPAGATDLDGRPRPSDGTGDCVRRGDVGAYELLLAPNPSATAGVSSTQTGVPVPFSGAACDSGSASPVAYHWMFDDGASADGQSVSRAFATVGVHVATLTVTDAEGQSAGAQATVTILPPAPPSILRLTAPRRGFTLGRGLPRLGGRAGRSLTVELSEPATVTLTAARLVAGRLRNGTCVAPRRAPHGRRCSRRGLLGGSARLALPAGTSLIAFAGRLTRRAALTPGRWELTLVARDAGGLTSRPRTLVVTIHRSRPHRRR